jgi:hypothetical protein
MEQIMTDRELLEALDLEYPGLEEVRTALGSGDLNAAKGQLVLYLRDGKELESVEGHVEPEDHPEAVTEQGEGLYERYAGRKENWCSVEDPEEVPERLYSTQVMGKNDHRDFVALAQAYSETGNHKYARECARLMFGWIEEMAPLPERPPIGLKAPPWRTIFYSTPRTEAWTQCFFLLRDYPELSVDERLTFLKVVLHHIRYAAANEVPDMPNMVVHLFERLIHFGLQWPEFAESRSWIEKGVEGLNLLLDDYFYPDGAYIELCYFVHQVFVQVARMGEQGILSLPEGFGEKVGRIFDFPAYMVKPNGAYPSVNDIYSAQDPDEVPERREGLVLLGLDFLGREDLRYIHTYGREGSAPPLTSCAFPYGGFYVMRSDWSAEARYLVFDGGKSAGGHNHVDKLNFELYAYGNTLVTDSGCAGPWASAWRSEYFVGTAGHNTLMVDGRGQVAGVPLFAIPSLKGRTPWHQIAPEPLANSWMSGEHFDYAESRYEDGYATYGSEQSRLRGFRYELNRVDEVGQMQPWTQAQGGELRVKPCERVFAIHERKVFFVKPDYWILSDRVLGKGRHRVDSLFHFQASATAEVVEEDRSVRTVNGRAGLTILPVTEPGLEVRIASGEKEPLQGWVPAGWGAHQPAPAAVYSVETDLPMAVDTVLYPYPRGEGPELGAESLAVSENGETCEAWEASGLRVRVDGREDFYVAAHDRTALRRYGPVCFDGKIGVIRCDEEGGIWRVSIVNGSFVEVAGEMIVDAEHAFESLELAYEDGTLSVRCHPEVGATVRVGKTRRLVVNGGEPLALSSSQDRVRIFEDWLD